MERVLTQRQEEVLNLVKAGYSMQQIANTLFISIPTVRSHYINIKNKLNATTMAHAVWVYYSERGK